MPHPMFLLTLWLGIINLVAVWMIARDKRAARRGKRRIAERTLMLVALLGGSVGTFSGMLVFHHKTKKPKFTLGVPLFFLLQTAAIVLWHVVNR